MTRLFLFSSLSAVALTAACTVPEDQRNTAEVGGFGAVAGGIIAGVVSDGDPGAIAAGAAAGGIIGASLGSLLDQQAADLRQDLGNDAITVTNTGQELIVNFPQDILFATDSATVSASQRADLGALARNLNQYPNTTVQVIGHTDNTGDAGYNVDLSTRRAGAVSSILVGQGVSGPRITPVGRGEDQPVASNLTPEGRAQNRRVEVVITPIT
ncbi:MAG: OmpA family protein [Mangrovicoccus sp.]